MSGLPQNASQRITKTIMSPDNVASQPADESMKAKAVKGSATNRFLAVMAASVDAGIKHFSTHTQPDRSNNFLIRHVMAWLGRHPHPSTSPRATGSPESNHLVSCAAAFDLSFAASEQS